MSAASPIKILLRGDDGCTASSGDLPSSVALAEELDELSVGCVERASSTDKAWAEDWRNHDSLELESANASSVSSSLPAARTELPAETRLPARGCEAADSSDGTVKPTRWGSFTDGSSKARFEPRFVVPDRCVFSAWFAGPHA